MVFSDEVVDFALTLLRVQELAHLPVVEVEVFRADELPRPQCVGEEVVYSLPLLPKVILEVRPSGTQAVSLLHGPPGFGPQSLRVQDLHEYPL